VFRRPAIYFKLFILILIVSIPIQVFAYSHISKKKSSPDPVAASTSSTQMLEVTSNQFTQTEAKDQSVEKQDAVSLNGFQKIAENNTLNLYVDKKSLALKIQDKRTGYIWNSGVDQPAKYDLNQMWGQLANSALTINYINQTDKSRSESILTYQSQTALQKIKDGFIATVDFTQAQIEVKLEVQLDGDSISVSVPEKGIKEGNFNKLTSIMVYPFLGAEYKAKENGYMFIPDGPGALIRYSNQAVKADTPFISSIYGDDMAFQKTDTGDLTGSDTNVVPPQQIKMPVYGVVHGVDQNGFLGIVEGGANYGQIVAYPSGVTTNFNWVTTQFNYRYQYYQPTSKSMSSGVNLYQTKKNNFNIKLRFTFLENKNANYVGMAHSYQKFLVNQGDLTRHTNDKATVRLEFLGGETKKGLLWNSVVPMTKIADIPGDVQQLKSQNVNNLMVIYKGWTVGGLTGELPQKFPFDRKLGNKSTVSQTINNLKKEQVPMFFYTDYTKAFQGAGGYGGSKNVARKVSSETIYQTDGDYRYYDLSPSQSLSLAKSDVSKYLSYGISNLSIDTTGYTDFSDFNRSHPSTRNQTISTYGQLFQQFQSHSIGTAMYQPNAYAWKSTKDYLDVPMYSSDYSFITDTVPFLEIVLKGYIPYYAPFSNFNSDPKLDVLRMIDYGANPSFLLTSEPASLLKDTPSQDVYTSAFNVWKQEIVREYALVSKSLGQVAGTTIQARQVLTAGIVKDTYSNGKLIIVNYTDKPYNDQNDQVTVKAKDFAVIDGKVGQ
jgi:hypothetical protein